MPRQIRAFRNRGHVVEVLNPNGPFGEPLQIRSLHTGTQWTVPFTWHEGDAPNDRLEYFGPYWVPDGNEFQNDPVVDTEE